MSVLNKIVSYYNDKEATTKGVDKKLLALLQSNEHKEIIMHLRQQTDEAKQKELKDKLPCYTVAGTFSRRCNAGLIQPSGLACVDLDSAEDYDVIHLLGELKKIEGIAYSGLSCRGKRLFCIVPFKYPDKYVKHYERLIKSFNDLGLPMGDDCHKIISQVRYVSWNDDNTQFFNHDAKPYHLLPPEKTHYTIKRIPPRTGTGATPDNPFEWCVEQINKSHSFVKGLRTHYYVQLTRYCNIKGLPASETLNGCLGLLPPDCDAKHVESIVKNIYNKHANSHNKLPFTQRTPSQPKQPKIEQPTAPHPLVKVPEEKLSEQLPFTKKGFATETAKKTEFFDTTKKEQPKSWDTEINGLVEFFETATLPTEPIKLNPFSTITDVSKFIDSHMATVKANNGKRTFLPYLNRLQELKKYLTVTVN